jgi:tetratricopeptide (TPR) repeat protein
MMRHPLIFAENAGQIKDIMEKTPRPNRIREALGQLHEQQPPYFREYLRRFQEDPTSRVFAPLAEAYRRLGRLDDAIAICLEGLGHHPDFHGGRVVLAKCYLAKKQVQEARGELERVVRAVPENLLGQRLLGDIYLELGNKAGALHCYKMALLLAPADVALAEKVHSLESGERLRAVGPSDNTVVAPLAILPDSQEELESEIPPLWAAVPSVAPEPSPSTRATELGLQEILSEEENSIDDEAFKIEHVSSIFETVDAPTKKEITTETLGDLYFSQGQFDKALRIFEKLKATPALQQKLQNCRARLGVDPASLVRAKKVALLRAVVQKARDFA